MKLNQIRQTFLEFFKEQNHTIVSSSSLIPYNDPSLLFTNAGMVQFKDYFTGLETPSYTRAASSQKCVRAGGKHNDLENVGYTARHHTFFEMLGNFSFCRDYFKESAIEFAWRYLTDVLALDKKNLYITVFHEDEEAYKIWKKITGYSDNKIIRIDTNDNFWSMGDIGPCGPCSEIFFDHGDRYEGGLPGSADADGDRYIEIWNLVFMQYEQLQNGQRLLLPNHAIDTGMGLERIAAVLQGVNDNYDIDLFLKLRKASQEISNNTTHIASHKVIADHLRSSSFLIADGVLPSNEGRGYVLRRIMRRAMRHIHKFNLKEPMMHKLVDTLVHEMGDVYPELVRASDTIKDVLRNEELKFSETLDRGLKILNSETATLCAGDKLDGKIAFTLYDTYGFPLDLTKDILRAQNITVEEEGFDQAMAVQRQKARAAWSGFESQIANELWKEIVAEIGKTTFVGYTTETAESVLQYIIADGQPVKEVSTGQAILIFAETPFYGESGGQVADHGIVGDKSLVVDVQKYVAGNVVAHYVEVQEVFKVGDNVKLIVNSVRRARIKANHSATHLLHNALINILGSHVSQKGSVVSAEKLRFDFSHHSQLTDTEIYMIESAVNTMVMQSHNAKTELVKPSAAIESGAIGLFGEKYGDIARVVTLGDSIELCGGTHVVNTGNIGMFKIISEESVASGIRRIEAVTGLTAMAWLDHKNKILNKLTSTLKCSENELESRLLTLQTTLQNLEKETTKQKMQNLVQHCTKSDLLGCSIYLGVLPNVTNEEVKIALNLCRNIYKDAVVILINVVDTKATISISVQGSAVHVFQANNLIQKIANQFGGKGGGGSAFAQLGGCNAQNIEDVMNCINKR